MTIHSPWETSHSKKGLIDIGTHRLFARVSGPRRKPGDPVILIECGGGSISLLWTGVMRALSPTYRIFTYSRAGLEGSDLPPNRGPRTAVEMADDFEKLLDVAGIKSPYIIVGHSYAGVQIRTWMHVHDRMEDIVGAVFVDTATEYTYPRMPIREPQFWFLMEQIPNPAHVLGYDRVHKFFNKEQWEEVLSTDLGHEEKDVDASAAQLKTWKQFERQIMEDKPVSVIKGYFAEDLRRLCVEAERIGAGTPAQRQYVMENLDSLDRVFEETETEQLRLSSCARMVHAAPGSGHTIVFSDPEIVMNEIKWVVEQYEAKRVTKLPWNERREGTL